MGLSARAVRVTACAAVDILPWPTVRGHSVPTAQSALEGSGGVWVEAERACCTSHRLRSGCRPGQLFEAISACSSVHDGCLLTGAKL